jgi:phospholipase C
MRKGLVSFVLLAVFAIAACSGSMTPGGAPTGSRGSSGFVPEPQNPTSSKGKIQHVVIIVQENRSFDNFFDCFPGTDCVTTAPPPDNNPHPSPAPKGSPCPGPVPTSTPGPTPTPIQITFGANLVGFDIDHSYCPAFVTDYDGGKMDGFYWAAGGFSGPAKTYPYRVVASSQIQPYWDMATQYVLADRTFPTQASGSYTAHIDLIRGSTKVTPDASVIDYPWNKDNISSWGCDDEAGSVTSLLTVKKVYLYNQGPFPCFGPPGYQPAKYNTLRDLLDKKSVTWKYYVEVFGIDGGQLWNAFDSIPAVRYGPEWKKTNPSGVSMPETNFFTDLSAGKLAGVSWVIPRGENSDHGSPSGPDDGPDWVTSVVNAIGTSPYWNSTAIFVVWDDWGGYYDSVPPPQLDYEGLGIRVPMIVISPYAKKGYVSHVQYEFGSLVKFVETTFKLGTLSTTDQRANNITDPFNFGQKPRPFATINPLNKRHTRDFFLHEPPSKQPVDTQ